jgi:hypothetical protein
MIYSSSRAKRSNLLIRSEPVGDCFATAGRFGHGPGRPLDRSAISPAPCLPRHLYVHVHRPRKDEFVDWYQTGYRTWIDKEL